MTDDVTESASERTMIIRAHEPTDATPEIGHFVTIGDGVDERRWMLDAAGLIVGRQAPADVIVPSPSVSRRHCHFRLDGEWAIVEDLGSTNGTLVGGERIAVPTRVRSGAMITVGGVQLRYERRALRAVQEEAALSTELRRAVDYVRAILPEPFVDGPVRTDWWFAPSSQLGGDAFGTQYVNETTFAGFVVDVSGHGIGSAMHAVAVATALRRQSLPGVDFTDPASVAQGLNRVFPMEAHNGLMLTLWYFTYHVPTRLLRFCSAGHHPSLLCTADDPHPQPLWVRSPAIGMLDHGVWTVGELIISPGSRLYVFSDGAFEIVGIDGRQWSLDDLRNIVAAPPVPGVTEAERLYRAVCQASRPGPLDDDFSALVVTFL